APFGSMERFLSILIEHFAGNFPFWIAPVQVSILPISEEQHEYAKELNSLFESLGYRVKLDLRNEKISRKVAESEQKKIPYAIVLGKREQEMRHVSVREHGVGDIGSKSLEEIQELFASFMID
ncbi:MAG: His/Gly/Thr/Pro-type tRNA ligase C-terminal domain-containing protein, partial [Bacteroidota bacterium]